MKIIRSLTYGVGVAAALALNTSDASAQCGSTYTASVRWGIDNSLENTANACGPAALSDIWVRVLSGSSGWAQELYFLGVDDGVTDWSASASGSGSLIQLTKPASCSGAACIWDATPYSQTHLGAFTTGSTLMFGLKTGPSGGSWLVSGYAAGGARAAHLGGLYDYGYQGGPSTNVFADDRATELPPPSSIDGYVYGWDDGGIGPCGPYAGTVACSGGSSVGADKDYQDLLFELSAVPEPASIVLLASGLIGVGGVAAARRRRRSE